MQKPQPLSEIGDEIVAELESKLTMLPVWAQKLRAQFRYVLEHNNVLEQVTLANWKEGDSPSLVLNYGGLTESLVDLLDKAIERTRKQRGCEKGVSSSGG